MSDWLKRQSDEFVQARTSQQNKETLIATSDHWAKIRRQIENDIQFLNTESAWAAKLRATPIKIVTDVVGEIRIEKETVDAVYCAVRNHIESIQFDFKIVGMNFKELKKWKEDWQVDSDGTHVMLSLGSETLVVPEQVSEHALQPIIDMLKSEQ